MIYAVRSTIWVKYLLIPLTMFVFELSFKEVLEDIALSNVESEQNINDSFDEEIAKLFDKSK